MTTSRLIFSLLAVTFLLTGSHNAVAQDKLPVTAKVERQPLEQATKRLQQTLKFIGSPLSDKEAEQLEAAYKNPDDRKSIVAIQQILDPHCLAGVTINPESRVSVVEGTAAKELVEQGWRAFLIKVYNEAGITPVLKVSSPQALPVYMRGRGARQRPSTDEKLVDPSEVAGRFLDLDLYARQPFKPQLSGLEVEYRIIHLFSRDAGKWEATLHFNVGQGTQDLGFRSELPVLFTAKSAVDVIFRYQEAVPESKQPMTAAIVVRDSFGRVYPNPARRLAPDFFFHDQVYRKDGESISLPPGEYQVTVTRGPEYLPTKRTIHVKPDQKQQTEAFTLERWIHPRNRNWYSGDHHVHAAGCKHYDSPTEGVSPQDMMKHILGEDLNVGCVLTWGPCWYSQKKYFEGSTSELSIPNYVMRYDIEVSGFPSSHAGHLCLL